MTDWNVLASAHARLSSLRTHVEGLGDVPIQFVSEYHSVLDDLESQGYELTSFRISPGQLRREVIAARPAGLRSPGRVIEGDDLVVEGRFFRMKADAVLNFFQLAHEAPTIGFSAPLKNP